MTFTKINLETWSRAETYRTFFEDNPCTYSMTIQLDITKLMENKKQDHIALFPTLLYGISRAVNTFPEFRMDFDAEGDLGYYASVNPSYTVFHPETEAFTTAQTDYSPDYNVFIERYRHDIQKRRGERNGDQSEQDGNLFHVSCVPWTSFQALNLNLQKGYEHLLPIFTLGKFTEEKNQVLLPLAIQVHHAVCDGFHISRFIEHLQGWADTFDLSELGR